MTNADDFNDAMRYIWGAGAAQLIIKENKMGIESNGGCLQPAREDFNYEVRVKKVMNGYLVNVGCKTLVFETAERMIAELTRYLANPGEVEAEYLKKYA